MSALKTPAAAVMYSPSTLLISPVSTAGGLSTPISPVSTPYGTTFPSPTSKSDHVASVLNDPGSTNTAQSIPLAGICIPDLPHGHGGWCIALHKWYDIDSKTGRMLKDWPDKWFKDSMRTKTAANLGGAYDGFLSTYPEADSMRVTDVLAVIRGKCGQHRKSWNGTPQQRYGSSLEPSEVDMMLK
ncbi:hypothetical protein L208DRAFT_1378225 [Tricholoma matsutake]|nr:hypothetical protein L208DRAFT_1378225 [Tricholoma matsutake 945]